VVMPEQKAQGRCEHCGASAPEGELRWCGHCLQRRYCSAECQRADWTEHKTRCSGRTADGRGHGGGPPQLASEEVQKLLQNRKVPRQQQPGQQPAQDDDDFPIIPFILSFLLVMFVLVWFFLFYNNGAVPFVESEGRGDRVPPIQGKLGVGLEDIFSGKTVQIDIQREVKCQEDHSHDFEVCSKCQGSGQTIQTVQMGGFRGRMQVS